MNQEQRQNLLGMKAFLCSEAFFFTALILGFVYVRHITPDWDATQRLLEWKSAGAYSLLLVLSSFTLNAGVKSFEKQRHGLFRFWAVATLVLGSVFLFNQLREYGKLIGESVLVNNSLFGSAYYTLTGVHTAHVIIGLILLLLIFVLMITGKVGRPSSGVLAIEYYWHFVDVVWIVVYSTVYLGGFV